jgi:hypothetical protein
MRLCPACAAIIRAVCSFYAQHSWQFSIRAVAYRGTLLFTAYLVLSVDVCSCVQKGQNHGDVTLLRGVHKRCPALLQNGWNVSLGNLAALCRLMQICCLPDLFGLRPP